MPKRRKHEISKQRITVKKKDLSKCGFLTYLPYRLRKKVPIDIVLMTIVEIFIQMMNMIRSHVDQATLVGDTENNMQSARANSRMTIEQKMPSM